MLHLVPIHLVGASLRGRWNVIDSLSPFTFRFVSLCDSSDLADYRPTCNSIFTYIVPSDHERSLIKTLWP
jgi:hypothetical protein